MLHGLVGRDCELLKIIGPPTKGLLVPFSISSIPIKNDEYKYYREELDTAMVLANATMAQALFNNGVKSSNVTAQIFWLKARAGWLPYSHI